MEYGLWINEPFLRDLETPKKSLLLIEAISKYAKFRNILIEAKRIVETVDFLLEEIEKIHLLKLYTINYALKKFTDENNQNISAAIILAMIKKAYQTEAHREILKRWDQEEEKNRLAPLDEMQKEQLNKIARWDSWNVCIELCKNGNDLDNPNWINAIKCLSKDFQYKPDKELIEHFDNIAKGIIFAKVEQDKADVTKSRDQHKVSLKESLLIAANNIEGSDIESRITLLRRKLICKEYILKNVI